HRARRRRRGLAGRARRGRPAGQSGRHHQHPRRLAMLIWYLARGAVISAFAMLSLAPAVGALASRRSPAIGRRLVLQYVHRSAASTGLALLVLHIVTILADSYAGVGVAGALVPFAS